MLMTIDTSALLDINLGSIKLIDVMYALIVLTVGLIVKRLVMRALDKGLKKVAELNRISTMIRSGVSFLISLVIVVTMAACLHISLTSFVALLSVVGLAVSLAVQDTLENLTAGLMLLTTKPFTVGDCVSVDGITGVVDAVLGMRTVIRTFDGQMVHIPNTVVTKATLTNYTALPERRIDINVSASYADDTETVKAALLGAAARFPQVLTDAAHAPFAGLTEYGSSAIEYVLRVWVPNGDYLAVSFGLREAVREAFNARGVTMTYDHLNVHIDAPADRNGSGDSYGA